MQGSGAVVASRLDRPAMIDWFKKNRRRSKALFDLLAPETYYSKPIPLRHPVVFYEGHLAAFNVNTLLKKGLGRAGIDSRLDTLFARGIDPEDTGRAAEKAVAVWPSRDEVRAYCEAADRAILEALETADLDGHSLVSREAGHAVLDRENAVFTILEHEAMHQETMLYMWHRVPHEQKIRPPAGQGSAPVVGGKPPALTAMRVRTVRAVRIPAGRATLGAEPGAIPFGWDNEFPLQVVSVPAFEIDVYNVTNADYLDFVEAGGYAAQRLWTPEAWRWRSAERIEHPLFWERRDGRFVWRGMFEEIPLPPAWPVYVSQAEAAAYARWKGARLPTEAELHRAAYGEPAEQTRGGHPGHERAFPWGREPFDASRGNADFEHWDPVPVGSYPSGASAWGVHDLIGNGWEWTSTIFKGFPGFEAMASYPEYSADFFDDQHYVMKGGSPATARELLRRSFRNWFRPNYPYVYATFRCVKQ